MVTRGFVELRRIGAAFTEQEIGTSRTGQAVSACSAEYGIATGRSVRVCLRVPEDSVAAGAAPEDVATEASLNKIIKATAVN